MVGIAERMKIPRHCPWSARSMAPMIVAAESRSSGTIARHCMILWRLHLIGKLCHALNRHLFLAAFDYDNNLPPTISAIETTCVLKRCSWIFFPTVPPIKIAGIHSNNGFFPQIKNIFFLLLIRIFTKRNQPVPEIDITDNLLQAG